MKKHEWVWRDGASDICGSCGHAMFCVVHENGGVKCRQWRTPCEVEANEEAEMK